MSEDQKKINWVSDFNNDPVFKKKIIKTLERQGYPLEFRASNLFPTNYRVYSTYYGDIDADGKRVNREIDLLAIRKYEEITSKIPYFNISLNCSIIGDCKSTINRDLLVFESPPKDIGNIMTHFPVATGGKHITIKNKLSFQLLSQINEWFGFTNFSQRVTSITVTDKGINQYRGEAFEKSNDGDQKLYRDCNQILNALNYYYENENSSTHSMISNLSTQFQQYWSQYSKSNQQLSNNQSEYHKKYCNQMATSGIKPEGQFEFQLFFPILVLNNETQLILAKMDKSKKPELQGFEIIDHLIYLHAPGRNDRYKFFGSSNNQAILITTEEHLSKNIEKIENGLKKFVQEVTEITEKHPGKFTKEIVAFNAGWKDPLQNF